MSAEWVGAAIFSIATIFAAGKVLSSMRGEIRQLKTDLNGIGRKVRRQRNLDLVLIAMTDSREERLKLVSFFLEQG